ncbi:MAG: hypothetical protein JWL59_1260 [Chthoniobacteraceae bacterium]|nr:hypothetical protein [Chthoniobacteraceae bacterium]
MLTAILLMAAWFIATNHCVLGLMKVATTAEHSHCHGGKTIPGKEAPYGKSRECCKTIQAAPGLEKFDASSVQLELFVLLDGFALAVPKPAFIAFDHGSVRSISFAELVLQGSLFSHAPPFAV